MSPELTRDGCPWAGSSPHPPQGPPPLSRGCQPRLSWASRLRSQWGPAQARQEHSLEVVTSRFQEGSGLIGQGPHYNGRVILVPADHFLHHLQVVLQRHVAEALTAGQGRKGSRSVSISFPLVETLGFPDDAVVNNQHPNIGNANSIHGSGRFPEEGNSNPLYYSGLENPIGRGACWATVHGVPESDTAE